MDISNHIRFLESELQAIANQFIKKISTPALSLYNENEVFASLFQKVDDKGNVIVKMRNTKGLPRKGEYYSLSLLNTPMHDIRQWEDISWKELCSKYQHIASECVVIWLNKTDNPNFSLVGLRGVSVDFVQVAKPNNLIFLGPNEPPTQYYKNLQSMLHKLRDDSEEAKLLDAGYNEIKDWAPTLINQTIEPSNFIIQEWGLSNDIIIQGPPGTGKTYTMAEVAKKILESGNSVLFTALTNRALMELIGKDSLKSLLEQHHVYKTGLTTDESKEQPNLLPIDNNTPLGQAGQLTLATFYVASKWADEKSKSFDFIIMDEASQAVLAMIVAVKRMSKKIIWIGDQCQLPPIVNSNIDNIIVNQQEIYLNGFKTICERSSIPSYMLPNSYRLSPRAVEYTGIFYQGNLSSMNKNAELPTGPYWIQVTMEHNNTAPFNGINAVMKTIETIKENDKKSKIAILTKLRNTVKELQKAVISEYGDTESIIVDTVERVQGLTRDYCIFFIPNVTVFLSLDKALFNVATSRATKATYIISDSNLLTAAVNIHPEVKAYLLKLGKEAIIHNEGMHTLTGLNYNQIDEQYKKLNIEDIECEEII